MTQQSQPINVKTHVGLYAFIFGLVFVMFHYLGNTYSGYTATIQSPSLFAWLAERWNDSALSFGGNYSHGWLVPLISGWLIWRQRKALRLARHELWPTAIPVLALASVMHWTGMRGEIPQLSALSLILMLWSIPAFLMGRETGKLLFFPLAYLIFAVPLNIFDNLTFPLRMLASMSASTFLNGVGIPVTRIGTSLHSAVNGGFHLEVADPCSGIRSLTAMMAVAAAYAYVSQKTNLRKWILFLSAIPLAVIGNTVRLLTVGIVAAFLGTELAVGIYHDYSGYIFYAVTISALLGIEKIMTRQFTPQHPAPSSEPTTTPASSGLPPPLWSYLLIIGICGTTMLSLMTSGKPTINPNPPLRASLPVSLNEWKGVDILFCQNQACLSSFLSDTLANQDECPSCRGKLNLVAYAELQLLPADTQIVRKHYQHPNGSVMTVTLVFSGQGRSSLHRPEICLPSQGFAISDQSIASVPIKGRSPLDVTLLKINHKSEQPSATQKGLFCYWFTGGPNRETESHIKRIIWMAQDRILRNTSTRWAYASVLMTPSRFNDDSSAELIDLIGSLYPLLQP
jgi:exosortase